MATPVQIVFEVSMVYLQTMIAVMMRNAIKAATGSGIVVADQVAAQLLQQDFTPGF